MTPPPNKKKIFLVDDHPLVREWLTNLIHQQPDLAVCGEAETAPDALEAIARLKPDVAIVDISLKDGSGIELIKRLTLYRLRAKVEIAARPDLAVAALWDAGGTIDAHGDAVPKADHHHADVENVAVGLLGPHLIFELDAGKAGQGAMPGRHLQARIAGKGLDKPGEQPLGKRVAVGLHHQYIAGLHSVKDVPQRADLLAGLLPGARELAPASSLRIADATIRAARHWILRERAQERDRRLGSAIQEALQRA